MHLNLLRSSLFIIYLNHIFYAPLGIGGPPIPGAKVLLSCPSANDFLHLEVGYMMFVSATRRYLALIFCSPVSQLSTPTILRLATSNSYRRPANTILKASGALGLMARVSEEVGVSGVSAARRYLHSHSYQSGAGIGGHLIPSDFCLPFS